MFLGVLGEHTLQYDSWDVHEDMLTPWVLWLLMITVPDNRR